MMVNGLDVSEPAEDGYDYPDGKMTLVVCKKCLKDNLFWKHKDSKDWKLFETESQEHKCHFLKDGKEDGEPVDPNNITCSKCKESGFSWDKDDEDRWRLHSSDGKVHACSKGDASSVTCSKCKQEGFVWGEDGQGKYRLEDPETGKRHLCPIDSNKTCKMCGQTDLRWSQDRSGWRLYDGESIHKC
jgi:hypothetical protein